MNKHQRKNEPASTSFSSDNEEVEGYSTPVENSILASELDDIIDRLINYDKYTGYTIGEERSLSSDQQLPYILKEKEIRQLISTSERVFK